MKGLWRRMLRRDRKRFWSGDELNVRLCEALGFDPSTVHKMTITLEAHEPASIRVEGYVRLSGIGACRLAAELKKYQLREASEC